MSGGHWGHLRMKLEERAGQPLNEVWNLLAAIEHELDYGICQDTCYDCARMNTVAALEAYFDTEATSIENAMCILRSRQSVCEQCKKREGKILTPSRESATVEVWHDGKMYKGVVRVMDGKND
jgi:hypothetical protein